MAAKSKRIAEKPDDTETAPKPKRKPREQVQVEISGCPKCGSTKRTKYHHRTDQEYRGAWKGKPCTHIIRRRTECLECGQHRIDIHAENRGE